MTGFPEFLEKDLAGDFEAYQCKIGGRPVSGWRSGPWSGEAGMYVVRETWRKANLANTRFFLGDPDMPDDRTLKQRLHRQNYRLYVFPGLPVADIAEFVKLGSVHEFADPDDWRVVREVLSQVEQIRDFEVLFADPKGMECIFVGEVSLGQVEKIGGLLLATPKVAGGVLDGPGGLTPLEWIRKEGRFKLWWD